VAAHPRLDRRAGLAADRRVRHPPTPDLRRGDAPAVLPLFCVLASTSALVRAAQLDPAGALRRVGMETRMGHTFKNGQSMADIVALAASATAAAEVQDWAA
jgi:hypothetical protein